MSAPPPVLSVAEARRAIESGTIDLLTSDVFDTLVWRPVSEPYQLFARLAERLTADRLLRAAVAPAVITHGRRRAERLARDRARRERRSPGANLSSTRCCERWSRISRIPPTASCTILIRAAPVAASQSWKLWSVP